MLSLCVVTPRSMAVHGLVTSFSDSLIKLLIHLYPFTVAFFIAPITPKAFSNAYTISQFCASTRDKEESFLFFSSKPSGEKQSHMGVEDRTNQRLRDMKNISVVCMCIFVICLCLCRHVCLSVIWAVILLCSLDNKSCWVKPTDTRTTSRIVCSLRTSNLKNRRSIIKKKERESSSQSLDFTVFKCCCKLFHFTKPHLLCVSFFVLYNNRKIDIQGQICWTSGFLWPQFSKAAAHYVPFITCRDRLLIKNG